MLTESLSPLKSQLPTNLVQSCLLTSYKYFRAQLAMLSGSSTAEVDFKFTT